tara:strand:+ start:1406 stop:2845 length:1440 start_codon:yes stop_codon:yes gene_type:complete
MKRGLVIGAVIILIIVGIYLFSFERTSEKVSISEVVRDIEDHLENNYVLEGIPFCQKSSNKYGDEFQMRLLDKSDRSKYLIIDLDESFEASSIMYEVPYGSTNGIEVTGEEDRCYELIEKISKKEGDLIVIRGKISKANPPSGETPSIYIENEVKENIFFSYDNLILVDFQYTYDRKVSHTCPGPIETLNFIYEGVNIEVTAQEKSLIAGRELLQEDFPDCINKGFLINFYNSSEGLPNGISEGCIIKEQLPSNSNKPEFLVVDCKSRARFEIFGGKFNECLTNKECTLIHGEDILFISGLSQTEIIEDIENITQEQVETDEETSGEVTEEMQEQMEPDENVSQDPGELLEIEGFINLTEFEELVVDSYLTNPNINITGLQRGLKKNETLTLNIRENYFEFELLEFEREDPNFSYNLSDKALSNYWEVNDWAKLRINNEEYIFPDELMVQINTNRGPYYAGLFVDSEGVRIYLASELKD